MSPESHPCHNRQHGVGLPAAIFVLVILSMIAVAIVELSASASDAVVFDVQSTRAFMAAESGAQLGVNRLMPPGAAMNDCSHGYFSASPSITYAGTGLAGCTATVSCRVDSVAGSDYFSLTSVGTCGSGIDFAERVIAVRVRQ
jgi:MSHA biogenesis protein MshP